MPPLFCQSETEAAEKRRTKPANIRYRTRFFLCMLPFHKLAWVTIWAPRSCSSQVFRFKAEE